MNPVHTFPPYFSEIQCNIIFPSTHGSSEWCLPFTFSTQNSSYIYHLFHACYIPRPCHPRFDNRNIWWSVKVTKFLIMQSSPVVYCHFLPLRSIDVDSVTCKPALGLGSVRLWSPCVSSTVGKVSQFESCKCFMFSETEVSRSLICVIRRPVLDVLSNVVSMMLANVRSVILDI
jgi:hypothetical protein